MDHDDHVNRDELILGQEDLEGDRRRSSEELLGTDPRARLWLERLQEVESRARELAGLDQLRPVELTEEEVAASDLSLQRLLDRMRPYGVASGARKSPAPRRRFAKTLPWLTVAAAIALFLVLRTPQPPQPPSLLSTIEVLANSTPHSTRGAEPVTGLVSGDAFSLRFRLARDACVAVVHVDPVGDTAIVAPPAELPAGDVQIPGDGEQWVLTAPAGRERFLLAVRAGETIDVTGLRDAVTRASNASNPDGAVARLRESLAPLADEVRVIEIDHAR